MQGQRGGLGGGPGAGLGGSAGGALLNVVLGMLGNDAPGGGLASIVQQFQRGGLGDVVQSWISSGQNLPVSADQISNVLGNEKIDDMAQQLGLDPGDLAGQLSQLLPQVVDQLTPSGQVPQGGLVNAGDLLGQLLRR